MSIFLNLPRGIYKLLILRGLEITPAVSFISILTINALSLPFFLRSLMIAFLLITHICLKFQLKYIFGNAELCFLVCPFTFYFMA